jgi:uncharacterized protein
MVKLLIKDSKHGGKGVFAGEDIFRGGVIFVLDGEIVSFDEGTKRVLQGELRNDDPLQIGEKEFLILDDFSNLFNHSCSPNAGLRKRSELFALRDIPKGEEITYDYSTVVAPNIDATIWTMKCNCQAENCRKEIGNILSIPPTVLQKYIEANALQDYMKNILKSIMIKSRHD